MAAPSSVNACELKNKLRGAALIALFLIIATPVFAQEPGQPAKEQPAPGVTAQPDEHATEEHAEEHSMWAGLLWPTVNFAILVGGLWYFFATPVGNYLRDRHGAIRKDLVEAANIKATAAAQLAEIDKKLQALPGEIEALRTRGAEEIAAEEARIAALASAERERLLEQTRREIEVQLRLAKRELVEHAADLAVQLASERIQHQITPADQQRIVDRYVEDVKRPH
jgi:F0F1-type ATP synthase membrane subunit b/b'